MFKKLSCVLFALMLILVTFGGCGGKQVVTAKVDKKASIANFAAYKKEIIDIMDKSGVKYKSSDMEVGNKAGAKATDPYMLLIKFDLQTELKEELAVVFTNKDKIENFVVSLVVNRKTLEECKLNISDYSYVRKIFNLVSEIDVSSFACNSLLRSGRKGVEAKLAENPDSFYNSKDKFFSRDKTKTWSLNYTIYMDTAPKTPVFSETLAFKGNLALRS
ncbi:MAG: hypothetical protein WCN92_01800 [Eubacteriales bacterium]